MAALLAGGSFAVHQLRFLLAYGSHSSGELAHQGHAYLAVLAPLVIAALMVAAAEFAGALARARIDAGVPPLRRLWAISTITVLAVYCAQELMEGFLASGHAGGLAGVFAGGGWLSAPLALAAGLVIALLMRGAAAVVALVAALRGARRPRATVAAEWPAGAVTSVHAGVFVCVAGPRAPPQLSG